MVQELTFSVNAPCSTPEHWQSSPSANVVGVVGSVSPIVVGVVGVVEKSSESPSMIHRRHRCGHAALKSPAADAHKLKLLP